MRTYKRKLDARSYKNYTKATLNEAVQAVLQKKLTLKEASHRYNIHKNTLWLKTKKARNASSQPERTHGRPTVFTKEEENKFVAHTVALSSCGFPITLFDLRCIVKAYLDKQGRNVPEFKNGNFPGKDWAISFMKRYKHVLPQRISKNISHARASNDQEVIDAYFIHLEKELENIPPENVWTYDEISLMDDPDNEKVVTRRGTKYPKQIKACNSLMFCASANGEMGPIYINYKSETLMTEWTENGPERARYNCTESGRFDLQVFEDWFVSLMLPILKRQEGPKAIIGDNLSQHISEHVLDLCNKSNVKFIALPLYATRFLQPLEVAFLHSLECHWREVLQSWKQSTSASRCTTAQKNEFPRLLRQLMAALKSEAEENIKKGFLRTGIYPLNKHEVLQRLPKTVFEKTLGSMSSHVGEVLVEESKKKREEESESSTPRRHKNLNVPCGKSISETLDNEKTAASTGSKRRKMQFPRKFTKYLCKNSEDTLHEENESGNDKFALRDSVDSTNSFFYKYSKGSKLLLHTALPQLEVSPTSINDQIM